MAMFWKWDEENNLTVIEPALAVNSDKPGTERIMKKTTYGGPALKAIHLGGYNTEAEHVALGKYMQDNNLEWPEGAAAIEVYVTDPETEPDTSQWITEVYYPYFDPGASEE
jgi:effector-binding domain-containing protein